MYHLHQNWMCSSGASSYTLQLPVPVNPAGAGIIIGKKKTSSYSTNGFNSIDFILGDVSASSAEIRSWNEENYNVYADLQMHFIFPK
jgi:hypothetical protein